MPLIRQSLLSCLMLLAVYSAGLAMLPPGLQAVAESQWNDNVMRAQRFLYEQLDAPAVLVGSSLARRLDESLSNQEIVNLSFGGQGPLDGLELIARSGTVPRLVLIEVNHIDRPVDPEFVPSLLRPGMYQMRKHMKALRAYYRPVGMLGAVVRDVGTKVLSSPGGRAAIDPAGNDTSVWPGMDEKFFEQLLDHQLRKHRKLPAPAQLERVSIALRQLLSQLRARGSDVILFEIPTHPRLCKSAHLRALRRELKKNLKGVYSGYITADRCHAYTTTDAHHLDAASAKRFSASLVQGVSGHQR